MSTKQDLIIKANELFNAAGAIASSIFNQRLSAAEQSAQLDAHWSPAYDRACQFAAEHNISKHSIGNR